MKFQHIPCPFPRWSHALAALATLALSASACSREQDQQQLPEEELSAVPPRPPAPAVEADNPAPLNMYEARGRKDDIRVAAERGESTVVEIGEPEAEARFVPVLDKDLRGHATLEKVGEAVQVELEVSGAPEGSRPVVLRHSGPCTETRKQATTPEQRLGVLEVGKDQQGRLQARIVEASLEPRDKETLLGSALVILASHGASADAAVSDVLACAQIHAE